ncbi:lipase family protein [Yinghuangia aomiensis]
MGQVARCAAVLGCVAVLAATGCSREGGDRSTADGGSRRPAAAAPSASAPGQQSAPPPSSAPASALAPAPAPTSVPEGDAFFDPPVPLPPQIKPGDVIRQRPFDVPGAGLAGAAKQTLVMYATTGYDGKPAAATGVVFLPDGPAPADGRPVVALDHGTTGTAPKCGPSRGTWVITPDPGDPPTLGAALLAQGYAVVQPDYLGLGATGTPHAYLYAKSAAYSTLDLVRAARNLSPDLGKSTFLTGNSQGGHAALWSGHYAPEYAPELHVEGIIAEAPAVGFDAMPDLVAAGSATSAPYIGIFLGLVRAATISEPGFQPEAFLTPEALEAVRYTPVECMNDPEKVPDPDKVLLPGADLTPIKDYLTANAYAQVKLHVPVLLTQGGKDILSSLNKSVAESLCQQGSASIEFKAYTDGDHTLGQLAVADDVAWIQARSAGTPVTGACTFEP